MHLESFYLFDDLVFRRLCWVSVPQEPCRRRSPNQDVHHVAGGTVPRPWPQNQFHGVGIGQRISH